MPPNRENMNDHHRIDTCGPKNRCDVDTDIGRGVEDTDNIPSSLRVGAEKQQHQLLISGYGCKNGHDSGKEWRRKQGFTLLKSQHEIGILYGLP